MVEQKAGNDEYLSLAQTITSAEEITSAERTTRGSEKAKGEKKVERKKKVWSTCPPRGTRIFDRLSHEHQIQKGLQQKKQRTTREHKEREVKNMRWTYR